MSSFRSFLLVCTAVFAATGAVAALGSNHVLAAEQPIQQPRRQPQDNQLFKVEHYFNPFNCTLVVRASQGCVEYDLHSLARSQGYRFPSTYKDGGYDGWGLLAMCQNVESSVLPPSCAEKKLPASPAYALVGSNWNSSVCYQLGSWNASYASMAEDGSLSLRFSQGEDGRVTTVNLVCDKDAGRGSPAFDGAAPDRYTITFRSEYACATKHFSTCPPLPPPPHPAVLPRPSQSQLELMGMGLSQFLCYNIDPFASPHVEHNCVNGNPDCLSPSLFKPSNLSTDQWVKAAVDFGAGEVVLTAHHEGGFCLWPGNDSCVNYTIAQTPYGKDILRQFVDSCNKYGVRIAYYIGPNANGWLTYDVKLNSSEFIRRQLDQFTEVLNNYGPVKRLWYDHYPASCGGLAPCPDTFGPDDWLQFIDLVRKLSPNTIMCPGPDCEGHLGESGMGTYPVWYGCTYDDLTNNLTCHSHGPEGTVFHPLETCATPIGGWFADGTGEGQLKWSLRDYWNRYMTSVGIGYINTLNSAPGTTGQVPSDLVAMQKRFGDLMQTFANPVGAAYNLSAPCASASFEVKVTAARDAGINAVMLREDLRQGQRIAAYELDFFNQTTKAWQTLPVGVDKTTLTGVHGITVGARLIDVLTSSIDTDLFRFRCLSALQDPVALSAITLHSVDVPPVN